MPRSVPKFEVQDCPSDEDEEEEEERTGEQRKPPPIPPRPGFIGGFISRLSPPPLPSRPTPSSLPKTASIEGPPTFLYLDPNTSNLVVHTSPTSATCPHGHVRWFSTLFRGLEMVPSREGDETVTVYQGGDGNLVTYADPFDDRREPPSPFLVLLVAEEGVIARERIAVWASSCVSDRIGLEVGEGGELEMRFLDGEGKVVKTVP